MEEINAETFEYQSSQFYIEQIQRLIEVANTNKKVEAWAPAIISFFSGRVVTSNSEGQISHSSVHLHAIFYAKDGDLLRDYFISCYENIINWVTFLYYYFRVVNGYPELSEELLTKARLLNILEFLENKVSNCDVIRYEFLKAYVQILPYSIGINEKEISDKCLVKLNKKYDGLNLDQTAILMSYRSIRGNRENKNYYHAVTWLKKHILEKSLFDNISIINTIYVEDKEYFIENFKIFKIRIADTIVNIRSDSSFRNLIHNLVSDNLVYLVQEIYYFLNFHNDGYNFLSDHRFILANGQDFIFYGNGEFFQFNDQYEKYQNLISSQNECLNSYTSLAFNKVRINEDIDYTRYHVADHKLLGFIDNTIDCYRVDEIDYSQFESITFLPIDTHPVQACIVLNKKNVPPLVNISFDGLCCTNLPIKPYSAL